ncbi:hypothetical protein [Vibrio sp. Evd11]|uniref:beta strand repeat-containing protein n=1 Tax=Vibrio sp. Evd11 TaxID=1207404 RepID=UPI0013C4F1D6|nr:hypothetical protein [Vibrio sp. Evd11]
MAIDSITDDSGLATDFITNDVDGITVSGSLTGTVNNDIVQVSLDSGATWNDRRLGSITDDSGLATDFITNDVDGITVSGSLTGTVNNDIVQVSLDGGTTWNDATVSGLSWSYADATTRTDGEVQTYQVRVLDYVGNDTELSDSQDVNFDIDGSGGGTGTGTGGTNSGVTAVSIDTITDDSGAADFITNDVDGITVSGSLTGTVNNDIVQVSLDGGATWNDATVSGSSWSYVDATTRSDGEVQTYQVRVLDYVGNDTELSDSQDVTFDIDGSGGGTGTGTGGTSSGITGVAIDSITDDSGLATDFITNDVDGITVSGSLTGTVNNDIVQVSLDSGATWNDATVSGSSWSYVDANARADGDNVTYQVRVLDNVGNDTELSDSQVVLFDTDGSGGGTGTGTGGTNSGITGVAIDSITDDSGVADFITNDVDGITVSGSLTGTVNNDIVQVSLDGGATWNDATVSGLSWSYVDATTRTDGEVQTYQVRVLDYVGNDTELSDSQAVTFDVDGSGGGTGTGTGGTNSGVTAVSIDTITDDSGAADFITNDVDGITVSGSLTGTVNNDIVQVSLDGGTTWNDATVSGSSWSYVDATTRTDGEVQTYQVRVLDYVGNDTELTASQDVTFDSSVPTIDIVAIDDFDVTWTEANNVVMSGTTTDVEDGQVVTLTVTDSVGASTTFSATVTSNAWSVPTDLTGKGLTQGTMTVVASVTDLAGNLASNSETATVDLPEAPTDLVWGTAGEDSVVVNTTTSGNQSASVTTSLADGRYVVAWNNAVGGWSSRLQMYNADGTKSGGETLYYVAGNNPGNPMDILTLSNGGFVISTMMAHLGTYYAGISVFDSLGNPVSSYYVQGLAYNYNIAETPSGDIAIVYEDRGGSPDKLVLEVHTTAGAQVLGPITVDASFAGSRTGLTVLDNGNFVVAFRDGNTNPHTLAIYNSEGTLISSSLFGSGGNSGDNVQLTNTVDGGVAAAYENAGDIYLQTWDSSGAVTLAAVQVTTSGTTSQPEIIALASGRYYLVWNDSTSVMGQYLEADGTAITPAVVIGTAGSLNPSPSIAELTTGEVIVSWQTNDAVIGDGNGSSVVKRQIGFGQINETAVTGDIVLGSLSFVDPDVGDTVTYSLADDANGAFAIDGATGLVTVNDASQIDYEVAETLNMTVRLTDSTGLTYDEVITITVSDGADAAISPTAGDDVLSGTSAADTINALAGNDTVYGGRGGDSLSGSAGSDTLVGSFGSDILTGGSDDDIFVFDTNFVDGESDTITDFETDIDKLDFTDVLNDPDPLTVDDLLGLLTVTESGGSMELTYTHNGNTQTVVLQGYSQADLGLSGADSDAIITELFNRNMFVND